MSLEELHRRYHDLFYLEDEAIFPLVVSMIVGARLNAPPVWLYLIGPSSGGKSTILSVVNKVSFVTELSDLTPNTFLSGMKIAGKETSLLKKLGNNFVVIMKDFTTMISKDDAARAQIVAQMREIYDGHISKATGNGQLIEWGKKDKPNKATFIMASTEAIFKIQEEFADMGTRAINYVQMPQDRKRTTRASMKNKRNNEAFNKQLEALQVDVAAFIEDMVHNAPAEFPLLPDELEEEIIDVADLSSMCRSVVIRDYRGEKSLALSPEFPMRMANQLLALTQFLTYVNGGVLSEPLRNAVYKVAFDSIPKQRRLALEVLARHPRIEVSAASMQMNYQPALVRAWIEDLHMFHIVDRVLDGRREKFKIREEYRQTLKKYLGIETVAEDLESDENGEVVGMKADMTWEEKEAALAAQRAFDEQFKG